MAARSRYVRLTLLLALVAAPLSASEPATPELERERDVLLERIARGEDPVRSVHRFIELRDRRDQIFAAAAAKVQREREGLARREVEHRTADHLFARCLMEPDPRQMNQWGRGADWGKVVRKTTIRMQSNNAFDEGAPATMYEIAGVRLRYLVHGERVRWRPEPLVAEVGDLLLLCHEGSAYNFEGLKALYPPSWCTDSKTYGCPIERTELVVRVVRPPLIVDKAGWKPLHMKPSDLDAAIRDTRWQHPQDRFVYAHVEVLAALGGDLYSMRAEEETWVLSVPPSVKRRELLVPEHDVWVIMGQPRFDKALKKLVLVAEDIEERWVLER